MIINGNIHYQLLVFITRKSQLFITIQKANSAISIVDGDGEEEIPYNEMEYCDPCYCYGKCCLDVVASIFCVSLLWFLTWEKQTIVDGHNITVIIMRTEGNNFPLVSFRYVRSRHGLEQKQLLYYCCMSYTHIISYIYSNKYRKYIMRSIKGHLK